jgi:hypothetical protein
MGMTYDGQQSAFKLSLKKNSMLDGENLTTDWKAKRLDRFVDAVSGGDYNGWEEGGHDLAHTAQNGEYNEDEIIDQTDDNMDDDNSPH